MYQRLHIDLIVQFAAGLLLVLVLLISHSAAAFDVVKIQINADSVNAEIVRVIRTDAPIWSAENGFAFSWIVESRRGTDPVAFKIPSMFREVTAPAAEAPILLAPLGTPCSYQPNRTSHSF